MNKGAAKLNWINQGIHDTDKRNPQLLYTVKGYNNIESCFHGAVRDTQGVHYTFKRYNKQLDMIQKASIRQRFGTRMHRVMDYTYSNLEDPEFMRKLFGAQNRGMTRDEVSFHRLAGEFDDLEGQKLTKQSGGNVAKTFKKILNTLRGPLLRHKSFMRQTQWVLPTAYIFRFVATIPHNLVIIGENRITFAYARHKLSSYVTCAPSIPYKWSELLYTLERALKLHGTCNAWMWVFYHLDEEVLGGVHKTGGPWVPIGV